MWGTYTTSDSAPAQTRVQPCKTTGGHGLFPVITAVCEQDQLLHMYNALHFATLV